MTRVVHVEAISIKYAPPPQSLTPPVHPPLPGELDIISCPGFPILTSLDQPTKFLASPSPKFLTSRTPLNSLPPTIATLSAEPRLGTEANCWPIVWEQFARFWVYWCKLQFRSKNDLHIVCFGFRNMFAVKCVQICIKMFSKFPFSDPAFSITDDLLKIVFSEVLWLL